MKRPHEATFASGVALGVFAALAVFVFAESPKVGAWLALSAGGGLGYALRSARVRDSEADVEGERWTRRRA